MPRYLITVPFLVIEAPTLTVLSPAEGSQFENGAVPVKGTTANAKTVSITAYQTRTADGVAVEAPSTPDPSASPGTATPAPGGVVVGPRGAFT